MTRGYFLDNGEELENPRLAFTHAGSHIQVGSNAWNISQAEEEVEEIREETRETLITADMTNADYGIADYIGSQDANIWAQMGHRVHPENWGAGGRDCLGCLCGGGSHENPNYSFTQTYNFTGGGTLTLKTRGSGERSCTIPAEGGTVVFEARGNSGTITLETTKITREIRINERQTTTQEIDDQELETREDEMETEEIEQENEEEMMEAVRQAETKKEQELEPEKEQEREKETEFEKEKEQETEKEDEKETEQEKEREQETETTQEQTQEQERPESEEEYESEDEL